MIADRRSLLLLSLGLCWSCNQDATTDLPPLVRRDMTTEPAPPPPEPESTRCLQSPQRVGLRIVQDLTLDKNVTINEVAVARDGNVLVLIAYFGEADVFGELKQGPGTAILKLARADLRVLWRTYFDHAQHGAPALLTPIPGGDMVVGGVAYSVPGVRQIVSVVQDRDGAVLRSSDPSLDIGGVASLAVNPRGEVAFGGGGGAHGGGIRGYPATASGFYVSIGKLTPQLGLAWLQAERSVGTGSNSAWVGLGAGGDVVFSSAFASPFGGSSIAPDGFLGQTATTGPALSWVRGLTYSPSDRYNVPMDARMDRNAAGQVIFGTHTVDNGTLRFGERSFKLDGKLWLGMIEGKEVRWLRSACSGDSNIDALRATADGGAVISGPFAGNLDLGGGPPSGSASAGSFFVARYGAGGVVRAVTRIAGVRQLTHQPSSVKVFTTMRHLLDYSHVAPDGEDVLVSVFYSTGLDSYVTRLLRLTPDGVPLGG